MLVSMCFVISHQTNTSPAHFAEHGKLQMKQIQMRTTLVF